MTVWANRRRSDREAGHLCRYAAALDSLCTFGLAFVMMVLILNAKRWFDPWNLFWEITIWMYAALLLLLVLGILAYGLSEVLRRLEK